MQKVVSELPIREIVPDLNVALQSGHAVVSAPPGSGKTTLLPLILRAEQWLAGKKIVILEPRRIAARAAAVRMSELIGEPVGRQIGYRIRFESRISPATKVEVVTEGILIRQLQNDPELAKVGLIIFDEFHERSIQADLGLALCLDLCQLRPDLRLLVMSATLETEALGKLLGNAPILTGTGKCYPVDIQYLPPLGEQASIAAQ